MSQAYRSDERPESALAPVERPATGLSGLGRTEPGAPRPRRASVPSAGHGAPARRVGQPLPALGDDFLSAALDVLCRDAPLSRAEIGDHADVVAEVADALAAVAERLAQDLEASDPEGCGPACEELVRARDQLQVGSSEARRGAAMLWSRHIEALRERVERARAGESPGPAGPVPIAPGPTTGP